MTRGSFAALVLALLPAMETLASAQEQQSKPPPLPPAPAALTVPNPFAGFQPGPRDLYRLPDGSDRFQRFSPHPPGPPGPTVVIPSPYFPGSYFPGQYYYPFGSNYYPYPGTPQYQPAQPVYQMRGGLVLETMPDVAQVYVDGFYVGLAEEFGLRGRALDLSPGVHHVELRAPGYETLTYSVKIAANETLRYRGDMQPLSSSAPPRTVQPVQPVQPAQSAQPAAAQKNFYVIPNCYAGDKPPKSALPRGCDPKNLQTRK